MVTGVTCIDHITNQTIKKHDYLLVSHGLGSIKSGRSGVARITKRRRLRGGAASNILTSYPVMLLRWVAANVSQLSTQSTLPLLQQQRPCVLVSCLLPAWLSFPARAPQVLSDTLSIIVLRAICCSCVNDMRTDNSSYGNLRHIPLHPLPILIIESIVVCGSALPNKKELHLFVHVCWTESDMERESETLRTPPP